MIPQIEPWIDQQELKEIARVISSGWITEGLKTKKFEEKFAEFIGAKYAVAVSNATVGLYICLKILNIGPGDEVIVPDLTFIATFNSILMAGAKPVLADIEKDTFNISPGFIESKINKRTKAIMPVHLYGQAADMEDIMYLAKKYKLYIVEDAAQGVGVKFKNRHVGTFGDLGCFSFYGNKTMTTGEGGIIATNSQKLMKKCFSFKNHGRPTKGIFKHIHTGFNFSFTDLQAAVGLAQLKKLNTIIELKKKIYANYRSLLSTVKNIFFPYHDPRSKSVFWFTNILVGQPGRLADFLAKNGIQTRRFFYPLHKQPCIKKTHSGVFINSDYAYNHGLSLPSSARLNRRDQEYICRKITEFFKTNH